MHDCMVVEFTLVAYRREDIALQKRGSVENHERLIHVARKHYLFKRLFSAVNRPPPLRGMNGDTPIGLVGGGRSCLGNELTNFRRWNACPGPVSAGTCSFRYQRIQDIWLKRSRHNEQIGRHQEFDEHRFQYFLPEVPERHVRFTTVPILM